MSTKRIIIQTVIGCIILILGVLLFVFGLTGSNFIAFFFGLVIAGTGLAVIFYREKTGPPSKQNEQSVAKK